MPEELAEVGWSDIESFLSEHCRDELNLVGQFYPKKQSITIDFQELQEFSPQLSEQLLANPEEVIAEFEKALDKEKEHIAFSKPDAEMRLAVRFGNLPAENEIMVKDCTSHYLGKMFRVQGLITTVSDVKPKVWKSVFVCKRCKAEVEMIQDEKTVKTPMACDQCGRREFDLVENKSKFIDFQRIGVQEPLEVLKGSQQATKINVWLENDLTNKVLPGQRIIITGILRLEAPKVKATIYEKFVEANCIEFTDQEFEELEISDVEEKKIRKLSKEPKIIEKVVASVAPSIYGHTEAKEAIAMQLFGGASNKKLPDGMKIRGNIHILLIGDPGTAKSQILKYVNRLAPKSLYVSGKSATGGGLTAIAEKDEFGEGGWVLKAGALVLASGGLACIDEFDKMTDEDRSAIHEALEQQTVSVAKAGIIATFKSESAVLAAANPKYSRFDPYKPPAEQFDIPSSLLSRFDLIFPIKDVMDETKDKELAKHMVGSHRLAQAYASGSTDEMKEMKDKLTAPIEEDLLKKYIAYSRKNCHPILSEDAGNRLGDYYVSLRKNNTGGGVPLTPRQLEGLIRLAEASAKLRLSKVVEIEDAERAIRLVEFVLRELGMEKGSSGFDIDRIMAEHPKSERDKIYSITNIVKGLEAEYDMVPISKVLEDAQQYHGIDNRTAEKLIQELTNKGDLYEPRHGYVKAVTNRG